MISEGSCDTEDWSNDTENSALHNKNELRFKYIQIKKCYFKLYIFSQYFNQRDLYSACFWKSFGRFGNQEITCITCILFQCDFKYIFLVFK